MKYLFILLLMIGCGKIDVKDSQHTVIHKFELPDLQLLCEEQNQDGTNEEIELCVANYQKLIKGQ